jgi:hypothetical protein
VAVRPRAKLPRPLHGIAPLQMGNGRLLGLRPARFRGGQLFEPGFEREQRR